MKKHKGCPRFISILAGLLLNITMGVIYADQTSPCAISCTSDLKQCRDQANLAANYEAKPIINDGHIMANNAFMNGQSVPFNDQFNSANVEIEKHRNERYQQCETNNKSCLRQCLSEQESEPSSLKKNSVIYK